MTEAGGRATLVMGVGNPLCGDDGAGLRAAELLMERELPPDVRVEAVGAPGLGLANWLEGCSKVILVDAARMGRAPGAWRRFAPEEVRLIAAGDVVSLHQAGVAEGLALAQALHLLPEEVVIYGLEPARCDERPELSPDVRQALPELVEAILTELRNPGGRASKARRA